MRRKETAFVENNSISIKPPREDGEDGAAGPKDVASPASARGPACPSGVNRDDGGSAQAEPPGAKVTLAARGIRGTRGPRCLRAW